MDSGEKTSNTPVVPPQQVSVLNADRTTNEIQSPRCCGCGCRSHICVWVVTILWVIGSAASFGFDVVALTDKNQYRNTHAVLVVVTILNGYSLFASLFGIFALCCARVWKVLRIYSFLAYGIVGVVIISFIINVADVNSNKSKIIDDCVNGVGDSKPSSPDDCDKAFKLVNLLTIILGLVGIALTAYFAWEVTVYARYRRRKEALHETRF